MSGIPPAARFQLGRDGIVYLYEVLSRIELPPEADIPDAAAYADAGDNKEADEKPVSWTIPHTEITLARVADGPRAGQFLFSSATVARAEEFFEKARTLPYRCGPREPTVEVPNRAVSLAQPAIATSPA